MKLEEAGLSGVTQNSQCAYDLQAALARERTSGRFIEQNQIGAKLRGQEQRSALAGVKRSQCLVRLFLVRMNF